MHNTAIVPHSCKAQRLHCTTTNNVTGLLNCISPKGGVPRVTALINRQATTLINR